jgi:hypothetical protein
VEIRDGGRHIYPYHAVAKESIIGHLLSPLLESNEYRDLLDFIERTPALAQYFLIDGGGSVIKDDTMRRLQGQVTITNLLGRYVSLTSSPSFDEDAFARIILQLRSQLLKSTMTHRVRCFLISTTVPQNAVLPGGLQMRNLSNEEVEEYYNWARDYSRDISNAALVSSVLEQSFEMPRGVMHGFLPLDTEPYEVALRLAASSPIIVHEVTETIESLSFGAGYQHPTGQPQVGRATTLPKEIDMTQAALAAHLIPLLQKRTKRTDTAVRRLLYAAARDRIEDELVDLVVGLESLISGGQRDSLAYKFRLRVAALIGRTGNDRMNIMTTANHIYDTRSKVAHGDTPKHDVNEMTKTADAYLRRAIAVLIERPEFLDADTLDRALVSGCAPFVDSSSYSVASQVV